ncbi:MAG: hypothetical protein ACE5PO_02055, partial [Candidatus Bathyarchaeia archaeon]
MSQGSSLSHTKARVGGKHRPLRNRASRRTLLLSSSTVFISLMILLSASVGSSTGQTDGQLSFSLQAASPQLPADGASYPAVIVTLLDANGPTPALEDISISLSSSDTRIGTVDPTVTLVKGETYTIAVFHTSKVAGSTTITASTPGFAKAEVGLTTVTPRGTPTKFGVYAAPSKLPATQGTEGWIIVRLEDSQGFPARATEAVKVTLATSNPDIGTVPATLDIEAGTYEARVSFRATLTPGTTTVSAATAGLTSGSTTVTTTGSTPSSIAIAAVPATLHVDDRVGWIVVQARDSAGQPAKAQNDIVVTLSSSNTLIANPLEAAVIPAGGTTTAARIGITTQTGSVTITALATGFPSVSASITVTTGGGTTTGLAFIMGTSVLPADGGTYSVAAVQRRDASGAITSEGSGTSVSMSTSNSKVGSIASGLIEGRKSYTMIKVSTTRTPGSTVITAFSPGLSISQGSLTVSGQQPSSVVLQLSPSTVLADGATHEVVVVQLRDTAGNPFRALTSTPVTLTSSNTAVGVVEPQVTIPAGKDHVIAKLDTTTSAGSTTLSGLSAGYSTGTLEVTTSGYAMATLSVRVSPSTLQAINR